MGYKVESCWTCKTHKTDGKSLWCTHPIQVAKRRDKSKSILNLTIDPSDPARLKGARATRCEYWEPEDHLKGEVFVSLEKNREIVKEFTSLEGVHSEDYEYRR